MSESITGAPLAPRSSAATRTTLKRRLRIRRLLGHDLLTQIGASLLALLIALALFGPVLPMGDPDAVDAGPRLSSPSGSWLAGTDNLGRSQLPRLVEGLRTTLWLAGLSVVLTAAVSIMLGMIAAYYGGLVGELIARAADVFFAFPAILLALLVVAMTGPGATGAVISIALICSPLMIRVVRAGALTVVNRDFIVAARVGGTTTRRILLVHLLPNIAGVAIVQGTYALSVGMLVESTLSFLGLGLQPPRASLGSLVHDGSAYLPVAPWLVLFPGALLALVIVSVNLVGDGLRDALDVRGTEIRQ